MIGDVSKVIETLLSKEEDVDVVEFEITMLRFEDGTSIRYLESPWESEKTGYCTSSNLVVSADHWARAQGIRIGSRIMASSSCVRVVFENNNFLLMYRHTLFLHGEHRYEQRKKEDVV